ncbi:MAG: hypothetical protein ACOYXT_28645 [Bacteroidota bacterium]
MVVISERLQSDLAFFNDELNFFLKLIDKYFMWLIDEKNIENIRKLASDISRFEARRFTVSKRLTQHVKHLVNLLENPFSHDAQACKDEQNKLETLFADFTKDFRRIKNRVFMLSERVIESEKMKHLLSDK